MQYRQRNVVERCIAVLRQRRRITTRYEKLVLHFFGILNLAMLQLHLHKARSHTP